MKTRRTALLLLALTLAWPVAAFSQTIKKAAAEEAKLKNSGLMAEPDSRETVKKISAKKAVMVLPTRTLQQVPAGLLEKTTEILSSVLIDLGRFQVVDRKALKKAMEQIALSASGLIPDDKQVAMGKIVGATEVIEARIDSYTVELKDVVNAGGIAANLALQLLTGGKQSGDAKPVEKQWVATVAITIKHKDLATGEVKNEKTFKVESIDKDQATAVNNLDGKIENELTFTIKAMFPIVSFIVKKEGRDTFMRLGADMGIRPYNKYFAYKTYDPKGNSKPIGELRIREVFPALSRGTMRIEKEKISENYAVVERNMRDAQIHLSFGLAPFKVDTSTFKNFSTYATFTSSSYFWSWSFGISNFIDLNSFSTTQLTYAPQVSLSYAKEIGPSTIDFRLSGLMASVNTYGVKVLLGYGYTILDRDAITAGFSVRAGAAGVLVPVGKMKDGWTIYDGSKTTKANADISIFGSTPGGEVTANLGLNLGYDAKLMLELGYAYYLPLNKFSMISTADDDKSSMMNLDKFFDTSRVSPIDLSGLLANVSLYFMF